LKKINKSIIYLIGRILFLIVIPICFLVIWYAFDRWNIKINEIQPNEIGERGGFLLPEEFMMKRMIDEMIYQSLKGDFPVKNIKLERATSTFDKVLSGTFVSKEEQEILKNEISNRFSETLGFLQYFKIYKACLINNNEILIENKLDDKFEDIYGVIEFKQEQSNFYLYTRRKGEPGCDFISREEIAKLESGRSRPEFTYPVVSEIGPEDNRKLFLGLPYRVYVKKVLIDKSRSEIIIRVRLAYLFVAFFLWVLIWSYLMFHFIKVLNYLIGKVWFYTQ